MKTAILGAGSWGTALASVLADNGHPVILYGRSKSIVDEINSHHTNEKYLPGAHVNPDVQATDRLEDIAGADIVVLAVPTSSVKKTCQEIDSLLREDTVLVNLAKGYDPDTRKRMSEIIRENISPEKLSSVVSLIGPSHAEEVIEKQLTSVDAVSSDENDARIVQELFSNPYFRVYTGFDEIGAETGAALKNVMAIAAGILYGLGYRDNTLAALIARGLQEMIRYGREFGADPETFIGLTGIGDLVVTCTSENSRNFQAGLQIGKDNSVEQFYAQNQKTVEGINTARIVHEISKERRIDMPICEEVFQILYEGKKPDQCAQDLMLRDLKSEFSN